MVILLILFMQPLVSLFVALAMVFLAIRAVSEALKQDLVRSNLAPKRLRLPSEVVPAREGVRDVSEEERFTWQN